MNFNNTTAVDNNNPTIKSGELVSLLGESSCGKSTTLFILAGLYTPTKGDILFGKESVLNKEP